MADIFDQFAEKQPTGDIFDQIAPDQDASALAYSKSDQGYKGKPAKTIMMDTLHENADKMREGAGNVLPGLANMAWNTAKDVGYSATLGHTREALRGESPEPGPLSLRNISPPLRFLYDQGGTPRKIADVTAGVAQDATNLFTLKQLLSGAVKWGADKMINSPAGAPVQHEMAAEEMKAFPKQAINVPEPSQPLYEQLSDLNPNINLPNLQGATEKLTGEQALRTRGLKNPVVNSVTKGLNEGLFSPQTSESGLVDQYGKPIITANPETEGTPFKQLQQVLKGLNEKKQELAAKGGTQSGSMKYLQSSAMDDLEKAQEAGGLPGEASDLLKRANTSYKKESAQQELQDVLENKGILTPRQGDPNQLIRTDAAGVIREMSKDNPSWNRFWSSLSPEETANIKSRLTEWAKIPPLGPASGVSAGSSQNVIRGAAGALAGSSLGMAKEGASLGVLTPKIVSKIVSSPTGRSLLKSMASSSFKWTNPLIFEISQMASQAQNPETSIGEGVRNIPRNALSGNISNGFEALKTLLRPALVGGK